MRKNLLLFLAGFSFIFIFVENRVKAESFPDLVQRFEASALATQGHLHGSWKCAYLVGLYQEEGGRYEGHSRPNLFLSFSNDNLGLATIVDLRGTPEYQITEAFHMKAIAGKMELTGTLTDEENNQIRTFSARMRFSPEENELLIKLERTDEPYLPQEGVTLFGPFLQCKLLQPTPARSCTIL